VLVLGDMLELGPQEEELHRSIGPAAAALSPALLVCFGPRSAALGAGAIAAGLPPGAVLYTDDPAVAAQAVLDRARSGDVVLVKASRGTRLERVSDRLAGLPPEGGA
jgi:UDP-N-acetylmuramoyl-tripeptide--D-alanyl-D-alanine ligase